MNVLHNLAKQWLPSSKPVTELCGLLLAVMDLRPCRHRGYGERSGLGTLSTAVYENENEK